MCNTTHAVNEYMWQQCVVVKVAATVYSGKGNGRARVVHLVFILEGKNCEYTEIILEKEVHVPH